MDEKIDKKYIYIFYNKDKIQNITISEILHQLQFSV